MNLRDALNNLASFNRDHALYVASKPVDLSSEVFICAVPEDDSIPPEAAGTSLLIDVWHASETLRGLEQLLRIQVGRAPTQDELFNRFILYLDNDA